MSDDIKYSNEARRIDLEVRGEIIDTLKAIGYPENRDTFRNCSVQFSSDGETLKILGHPVMEKWETPYMEMLARIATSRCTPGRVLELGFGMGLSAGFIQRHSPLEHVIIEANAAIADRAREFAAKQKNRVTVIEGFWEEVVPTLPSSSFQGILFDTYPLSDEEVDFIFHPFVPEAFRLLASGGVFTYFSDEPTWFGDDHLNVLHKAGFSKIDGELCNVTPPADCQYWKQSTILAPIVER